MVGYFLDLPYLPNSYRLPFRQMLYRRAKITQNFLPAIQSIEKEYLALAKLYFDTAEDNLELPFFLSSVLSQMSSPRDFFGILAETRRKASTFRTHRAELDEALGRGDVSVAKKLRDAIQQDAKNLRSL